MPNYIFPQTTAPDRLNGLKTQWLASLTSPQDGMWESFRNGATQFEICQEDSLIGYASVDADHQLLQFYLLPDYLSVGENIFEAFLKEKQIKRGIVGTNNPYFLTSALPFVTRMKVHTCLFQQLFESPAIEKAGKLKPVAEADIARIIDFCHYSIGAPKEWLSGYIGDLAEKGEVYFLEQGDQIIGTCEVRMSITAPEYADIGMIVSPDYRQRGYGTYLLHTAKQLAIAQGRKPICSCEKENVGSYKSITKAGFASTHQLLSVEFS